MPDLKELYPQVILDHNKNPQNFHKLADANRKAEGYNTLCGDRITLYARLENDVITDVGFEGTGCAIFKASASLMRNLCRNAPWTVWSSSFNVST